MARRDRRALDLWDSFCGDGGFPEAIPKGHVGGLPSAGIKNFTCCASYLAEPRSAIVPVASWCPLSRNLVASIKACGLSRSRSPCMESTFAPFIVYLCTRSFIS